MGSKIASVSAREIFAARGLLGLEVVVTTEDGARGVATPEAGVSTGAHEAAFVVDGGERYRGLGQRQAAENVNRVIGPALVGMDVTAQGEIDQTMVDLDGTPKKSRLGANAIVGVSLAVLKGAASSAGLSLYQYIGGTNARTVPIPIYGIGSGGRYRDPGTSRWFKPSYELAAYGAGSYEEAVYWSWRAAEETKRILRQRYPNTYVPQYHTTNLAGVISDDRELLDAMAEGIARCGYAGRMGIYFDCAADCYYEREIDRYVGLFRPGERTRDEQIAVLADLVASYPIVSLEDPLHENDFEGHAIATRELGIEVVGDDLFTTNIDRLKEGIAVGAANSMVLKISQVGTVSEALAACRLALASGYNVHPCGSRGDRDSIGDFAVGLNAGQVRAAGHNRLLEIEQELGRSAVWLGRAAYKGKKNQSSAGSEQPAADEGAIRVSSGQRPDARRDPRLDWWRDAKFGMFIHWGLYAVPAGEWRSQAIPGIGEWIMLRGRIPIREYEQLARQFNPVKFDAAEWVSLAKRAGQRYLVITSKHHDGFCMFDSKVTDYDIVDATPFGRDPLKELAAECQRQGIKLCFYYSQTQDWHHPDGDGNDWDYDEASKDFDGYVENYVKPHVRELLTNYGPIGLIWFDTPKRMTEEQSRSLVELVHELQPECLVNGRVGNHVGDYASTRDNVIPTDLLAEMDWETPATINDTWGFKKDDQNWKSTTDLVHKLIDVASKGGNYLLNVGPTAEGVIPEPSVQRLLDMGRWLDVNGEAIYGTRAWRPHAEGDTVRFTSGEEEVYALLLDWPERELKLRSLAAGSDPEGITDVRLLGWDQPLEWSRGPDGLRVTMPPERPCEHAWALKITRR